VKFPTKCERCARKYRDRGAWNGVYEAGVCVALLCPRCQTVEENAEAEVNEATLVYSSDAFGRIVARARVSA